MAKLIRALLRDPNLVHSFLAAPLQTIPQIADLSSEDRSALRMLGADTLRDGLRGAKGWGLPKPEQFGGESQTLGGLVPWQWQQADTTAVFYGSSGSRSGGGGSVSNLNPRTDWEEEWHAGRIRDVLVTAGGRVLAAAHNGGVWEVWALYVYNQWYTFGHPLSDAPAWNDWSQNAGDVAPWASASIACLAQGTGGPDHVYAGCADVIYETDWTAADPFTSWTAMSRAAGLPAGAFVRRILVIPPSAASHGYLVVATTQGVFWSRTSFYSFANAVGAVGDMYDLAVANVGGAVGVVAASRDPSVPGLYYGTWNTNGDLVFTQASIVEHNPGGSALNLWRPFDLSQWATTSVASCESHPEKLWAALSWPSSLGDSLRALFKSEDGGRNWTRTLPRIGPGGSGQYGYLDDFATQSDGKYDGPSGRQGDEPRNNTIAVHPEDPEYVVLGWRTLWATVDSSDIDKTYKMPTNEWNPVPFTHLDQNKVRFHRIGSGVELLTAGDGGLAFTSDLGDHWSTILNRNLLTMQFLGARNAGSNQLSWRGANLAVSSNGTIAGALQDDGDVVSADGAGPWARAKAGDGQTVAFLDLDPLDPIGIYVNNDGASPYALDQLGNAVTIQFNDPKEGGPYDVQDASIHVLSKPGPWQGKNGYLWAVAIGKVKKPGKDHTSWVLGLFGSGFSLWDLHFEKLGYVTDDSESKALPSGAAAIDANHAWVTDGTRVFHYYPGGKDAGDELKFALFKNPVGEQRIQFLAASARTLYALVVAPELVLQGDPLPIDLLYYSEPDSLWKALASRVPDDVVALSVADDDSQVFIARADGSVLSGASVGGVFSWVPLIDGLPPNISPQRLAVHGGYLFMSTRGRSLWKMYVG